MKLGKTNNFQIIHKALNNIFDAFKMVGIHFMLTLLFFAFFTPIGLFIRLKNKLNENKLLLKNSYRIEFRDPPCDN